MGPALQRKVLPRCVNGQHDCGEQDISRYLAIIASACGAGRKSKTASTATSGSSRRPTFSSASLPCVGAAAIANESRRGRGDVWLLLVLVLPRLPRRWGIDETLTISVGSICDPSSVAEDRTVGWSPISGGSSWESIAISVCWAVWLLSR